MTTISSLLRIQLIEEYSSKRIINDMTESLQSFIEVII
jgi:hypothetical protein